MNTDITKEQLEKIDRFGAYEQWEELIDEYQSSIGEKNHREI